MVIAALGAEQIKWLESVLEDATSKGQNVVICTHVPFYPLDITPIVWNAEEAHTLSRLRDFLSIPF